MYVDGADECPPGMLYQQCGSLCPRTCQNTDLLECISGCVSGCFCPSGQVMQDGRCIDSILCQGTYTYVHTHTRDETISQFILT